MPDSNKPSSNRWKVAALLAVLLVPCAVIGGNTILQNRARQSSNSLQAKSDAFNASLQLKPEGKQIRLDRAKELRDKWRPWALKHQSELRRMLGGDKSALTSVWSQVPTIPSLDPLSEGLAAAYQAESGKDVLSGKVFTWNALGRTSTPDASPEVRENQRKSMATLTWNQKRNFDSFRDIVIANSMQTGKVGIALWASGRVTESNYTGTDHDSSGIGVLVVEHKELVPPFDFLTN